MPSSSSSEHTPPKTGTTKGRLGVFDLVRGVSVVSMVLFHLCYDLTFIAGHNLEWFEPPLQDMWRCSISWVFLFIAGCMCTLSRNNLRRALEYGGVALAIWVVTTIVAVDTPMHGPSSESMRFREAVWPPSSSLLGSLRFSAYPTGRLE